MTLNTNKMMKIRLFTILFIGLLFNGLAQEGFNYQGILYDASGNIVRNTTVSIRITISNQTQPVQGSSTTYVESHSISVGDDGVINFEVGSGNSISAKSFSEIDWSQRPIYVQREVDFGQGYQLMGYSKILSVPIAQYSLKSGDSDDVWVRSNTNSDTIIYDKQVIIGNPDNQLAPPLKVYGTDTGPASASMQVFRSSSRNNVIVFTTSGSPTFDNSIQQGQTINSSIGILRPGYFESNGHTFSIGMQKGSNEDWTDPFTIEFGAPNESLSIESDGLVRISGTVSATAFRGDGSQLTNISGVDLFDSRFNMIENGQVPKAPSLNLSPTDSPDTTSFNESIVYSSNNVMIGENSGFNLTTGYDNIGIGKSSLQAATISQGNIALGSETLSNVIDNGGLNIAIGTSALKEITDGWVNIAVGSTSLRDFQSGNHNIAMGAGSLERLTNGFNNTAIGGDALNRTVLGSSNTAIGHQALRYSNQSGTTTVVLGGFSYPASKENTAVGNNAMQNNSVGSFNIAYGTSALENNGRGFNNSAIGMFSLQNNNDGVDNTALGWGALMNSSNSNGNTALGAHAGQYLADSSSNNTFIGNYSGVSEASSQTSINNSIAIGANAIVDASNTMVFGSSSVESWAFGRDSNDAGKVLQVGDDSTNGNGAYLTSGGVWTNASSIDFKTDIKRLSSSDLLSSINKLLVTKWRYKDTNEYHIGPFAEQFKELFNLGISDDNKHISTMDLAGISILGIQEQSKSISDLKNEVDLLKEENQQLKDQLNILLERIEVIEKNID